MLKPTTIRIIQTSAYMFLCYLAIGVLLAIVPGFVHLNLKLSPTWAGIVVSAQYAATLLSRPRAGRSADAIGPKATVMVGQLASLVSGLLLLASASFQHKTALCITALLASRVVLGCGESCIATGSIMWGLGRVGVDNATQVISWAGIASYSAMALGAPLGIWIERHLGFASVGAAVSAIALLNLTFATFMSGVPVAKGTHIRLGELLSRVLPKGLGLALGTAGFGVVASFLTLYFVRQRWNDPAMALVLFGVGFVGTRLLLANTLDRWGGFRIALASLLVEFAGLVVLWLAKTPDVATAAVGVTGCGFALVFPALGVELVREFAPPDRGAALGVYTAFLDLAMGITAPVSGYLISHFGYPAIFVFGSGAAICGCIVVGALGFQTEERPRRERGIVVSSALTASVLGTMSRSGRPEIENSGD